MTTDLDLHFPVQALQKIEQLVRGEAAEMPVHQVRHIGLCDPEYPCNFALFQFLVLQNFENMDADLRTGVKFAGVLQSQIGEYVAGAFLKLNWFSSFHARTLTYAPPRIASLSDQPPALAFPRLSLISFERHAKHKSYYRFESPALHGTRPTHIAGQSQGRRFPRL